MTERSCGDCRACCARMEVPEIGKPERAVCEHQNLPGLPGCRVYAVRPSSCCNYACEWLLNPTLPASWRPDRLGVIVDKIASPARDTLEGKCDAVGVPWLSVRETYPRAFETKRAARALTALRHNAALVVHFYRTAPAILPQESVTQ